MPSVAFIGSSDLAEGFASAGAQILSPKDREQAISSLYDALWSGMYAFVVISEPWASSLKAELTELARISPTPIIVLGESGLDLSSFTSALNRLVGSRIA
ncbi:MAG: V-type ATP synthase subunit F [Thermoprotei archaeon]|jgi:vacuolar-type H+-ATPase subunit F/Vma7